MKEEKNQVSIAYILKLSEVIKLSILGEENTYLDAND